MPESKIFFDNIAETYRSKYSSGQIWHHYFFTERLQEATKHFPLNGKSVLDIGAGTGGLYDFLNANFSEVNYQGCDISEKMLSYSKIPASLRHTGQVHELDFGTKKFDAVFMLGLTTYLDDVLLEQTLETAYRLLEPGGKLVVTFTNARSLDWKMRSCMRWLVRIFGGKNRVLASLKVSVRTPAKANNMVARHFDVIANRWLNHTIFPFYLPLKKIAVRIAQGLHPRLQHSMFCSLLSSDVLVIATKKEST